MAIKIEENIPLKNYSTMRVGGPARYLAHVKSKKDIEEAAKFAKDNELKILAIGRGANILFKDDGYDGIVLVVDVEGFEVLKENGNVFIRVGAGEDWDETVEKTVEMGLTGMEAMSLVPGTVGAAPVMNIGCYGQDLSEVFYELTAYDLEKGKFVVLDKKECKFDYRDSRFSGDDNGRFIIVDVTFRLSRGSMSRPFYKDVEKYFEDKGISEPSPADIREAVITIRRKKLPDPSEIGTNGSFFKNPVVSKEKWNKLSEKFPELDETKPGWPQKPRWFLDDGRVKIAAARLIELAGLEDYKNDGISIWPTQHLTIVNEGAKSSKEILDFKEKMREEVSKKFGILLEEEVRIM